MGMVPFSKRDQLNDQLNIADTDTDTNPRLFRTDGASSLPGQARIPLQNPRLRQYLSAHLLVPALNAASSWLWLVGTPRHTHISPLHHQAVRGRNIILTENPHLHLVWYYNQIFVKPVPTYLLSHAFWEYLDGQNPEVREAALGFVRTYAWLVRYERDFDIAVDRGLLPRTKSRRRRETSGGDIDKMIYDDFSKFIASFEDLGDEEVAPRYRYGELRLTRLNMYSRLFLRGWTYHHIEAQWTTFLGSFLAPFTVVFATLTVMLNAMQVELAVMQVVLGASPGSFNSQALEGVDGMDKPWKIFVDFAKYFPVIASVFVAIVVFLIIAVVLIMFVHDQYFAFRIIREKRRFPADGQWKTRKSGVV